MKTVQTMFVFAGLCAGVLAGCSTEPKLVQPYVVQTPYGPSKGEALWAIAPLNNESGVSGIDMLGVADAVAAAIAEVNGVSVLPLNRTLDAMQARKMTGVRSPREARVLAEALGVQGVVVGTVTAYDPYDPPTMGMTLALYTLDLEEGEPVNPKALQSSYTDQKGSKAEFSNKPASLVSEHLNASNHETLAYLKHFAQGRHDQQSALTWRRYTASMELYTEFVAYHCVRRLVDGERRRIGGTQAGQEAITPEAAQAAAADQK